LQELQPLLFSVTLVIAVLIETSVRTEVNSSVLGRQFKHSKTHCLAKQYSVAHFVTVNNSGHEIVFCHFIAARDSQSIMVLNLQSH